MKTYEVKLKGVSPMLHHGTQNLGLTTSIGKKKGGDALTGNPEEWKNTIYYDEETGVYLPAMNLEAAFIEAAKQFKVTGRTTATKFVKSSLLITEDKLPFYVDGNLIKDLDKVKIDTRTVKNPSTRGRNMRYRAVFHNWETTFIMTVGAEDYLTVEMLKEIIRYAGQFVGVGDFRPRFGRFLLTSLKEVKIK